MPRPGPPGPNHYSELRREAGGDDERFHGPDASPSIDADASESEEQVEGFREDNARMVAAKAAEQHRERREAVSAEVYKQSQENTAKLVEQAATVHEMRTRFEALGQNPADLVEEKYASRHGGRIDPNDPYLRSLRDDAVPGDPAETLRRAALADDAAFIKNYERFDERIAEAPNTDTRHSLEQQQDIYAADHLAETNHRIADFEEIITGSRESEEVVKRRGQAAECESQSRKVQDSYRVRTGRDAHADALSDEALVRDEVMGSPEASPSLSVSWAATGDEVTDRRLAELESRFGGDGSGADGPTRPQARGQSY